MFKFFKNHHPKEMTEKEIHAAIPSELDSKGLNEYIKAAKRAREEEHKSVIGYSVDYYTGLLNVAAAEKTNRANTRFSKIAIGISISSLIVATIGINELAIIFSEAILSLIAVLTGIWQ